MYWVGVSSFFERGYAPSFRSLTDQDSLQFIDLGDDILYLTQNNSEIL